MVPLMVDIRPTARCDGRVNSGYEARREQSPGSLGGSGSHAWQPACEWRHATDKRSAQTLLQTYRSNEKGPRDAGTLLTTCGSELEDRNSAVDEAVDRARRAACRARRRRV